MSSDAFSPVKYAALLLTHNCNLRCRYCYAGRKRNRHMDGQTAKQAVDFLHGQSDGRCTITFFGGEPLLQFHRLREIVSYSRDRYGRAVEFRLSTNGTLLDRSMLAFFREHEIYFTLSLDGHAAQHDAQRPLANRRGSYAEVATRLDDILAFNPYTLAVSVVVPETAAAVAEGVQHLFSLGFRYVLQTLDYSAPWQPAHLKELAGQYQELAEYYFERLMAGAKIYYSPFDERIKTWAQKPYGKGDLCDIANTQVAIAPSGRIYPCVQFVGDDDEVAQAHALGDVFDGFDQAKRRTCVSQNYSERESCVGCALNGRCANYCGCVNWRATGRITQIPPIICEHERMLMPIVDRMANRLWKRNCPLFRRKFYDRAYPMSSYLEDCKLMRGPSHAEDQEDQALPDRQVPASDLP